MNVTW
jgi:DNA-binding CsgD family transcriptional regulator